MVQKSSQRKVITIGTRGSRLALAQTQGVLRWLKKAFPFQQLAIKIIKTKGDKLLDSPLSKIGAKGLFVKELEQALLGREIDLAVHSLKDLPMEIPDGLTIGAITERLEAGDVLVTRSQKPVTRIKRIGTSSLRRKAQLLHWRPDFEIVDLRGNLDTRIRKLQEAVVDAIVVAAVGLKRLKVGNCEIIPLGWMLPAPGQGALAIECRKNDGEILGMLKKLNHRPTELAVTAERALLMELGGGCQVPIGAYAKIMGNKLQLEGVVADLDGKRTIRAKITGDKNYPTLIGRRLAKILIKKGADKILSII